MKRALIVASVGILASAGWVPAEGGVTDGNNRKMAVTNEQQRKRAST
jgi:hypothetical protein